LLIPHQLNASDERGIDVVREQVKQFAETRTLFSKGFKLIILDEADMMTQQAQAALRRVIEQYTKNVRFCIICNYVNKIIPAIQSRCTRFRFSPLPITQVEKRLTIVVEAEKCVFSLASPEIQFNSLQCQSDCGWQDSPAQAISRRHATGSQRSTSMSRSI
jgi:DNA polymerase III delta prime subunit